MLGSGAIAVAFSGCEMRLLPACHLAGQYTWQRTSVTSDRIEINNEAELYAKLPLGALSLGGELKKSGELAVETTVSGQARLQGMDPAMVTADPACAEATHVVTALSVGAYMLTAGGRETSSADASVHGIGTNGKLGQTAKIVRGAGVASSCSGSTEQAPAIDCSSPIQVFLARIPGRGEPEAPPGTVKVDFVSTSGSTRWDVYVDDKATCTTPCSAFVDPSRPLAMRTREDQQRVEIGHVLTGLGPVQVAARPRENGKFVTGLTFTALGGMGVITGIALIGVGCSSSSRGGLCTAGEYTIVPSAIVTGVAIWLMVTSLAKVEQHPQYGPGGPVFTF
jgi:hypothetical protein